MSHLNAGVYKLPLTYDEWVPFKSSVIVSPNTLNMYIHSTIAASVSLFYSLSSCMSIVIYTIFDYGREQSILPLLM
jgi:hypothetical protein